MYLFFCLVFGGFAGILASLDRQSAGIQTATCITLLVILVFFVLYVVNPSAVMSGIHSATGL